MSDNPYDDAGRHSNRYECPECGWSVWVDWWDGNGAVARTPVVECGNTDCESERMTIAD